MFEGKRNAENYRREMERNYIDLDSNDLIAIRDRTLKTASRVGKKEIDMREGSEELRSFLDMSITEMYVIDTIISIRERNWVKEIRKKYKNKRHRRFI